MYPAVVLKTFLALNMDCLSGLGVIYVLDLRFYQNGKLME